MAFMRAPEKAKKKNQRRGGRDAEEDGTKKELKQRTRRARRARRREMWVDYGNATRMQLRSFAKVSEDGKAGALLPHSKKGDGMGNSFALLLEFEVAEDNFEAGAGSEALGELFGEVDGAVLAAGASEGDHEILEMAGLVGGDASVDEGEDAGEKLVNGFLLLEIFNDRGVFAGEEFELFFAAGVGEAAAIEDEAAAVSGFVSGQGLVKRETKNAHDEVFGFRGEGLQFFRGQHAVERGHESGQFDGQTDVVEKPAKIFQGVGDALEEMGFAFVEAAKAVGAEGLHDTDENVGVVILEKGFAIELDKTGEAVEIVIEELLAKFGGQVGFGVVEKRGDVILQGAFAAALIVDEKGIAVAEHDVAGLEIAIEEIIARGAEEEISEAAEIVFEGLLVERDAGEAEKIVFEIVEVPGDGLAIEAGNGIADSVVQIEAGFDLEAREDGDDFAIGFDNFRSDICGGAMFGEKFEEGGIAEIFLEIGAVGEVFGVDLGDGKTVAAKMFGEFEKGDVFLADAVEDADGGGFFVREADDFAAGAAEFALERLNARWRRVEVLLEEFF
jgi:hypothetical protein